MFSSTFHTSYFNPKHCSHMSNLMTFKTSQWHWNIHSYCPEPPGLRRPQKSHSTAGWPEPRATSPAVPFAGSGQEQLALRDGSTALGLLPQLAEWVQCHRPALLDLAIQLVEDQLVACSRVGESLPTISLSSSFSSSSSPCPTSTSSPRPVPLPRSRPPGPFWGPPRVGQRQTCQRARELCPGGRGTPPQRRTQLLSLRSPHANLLPHSLPLGQRRGLGRPAGVAGTQSIL